MSGRPAGAYVIQHGEVDRGAPVDLAVLDDVGASRATAHAETTALTVLALLVMTGAAARAAAHRRGRDDSDTVLLIRLGEHPFDRDRILGCADDLGDLHDSSSTAPARWRRSQTHTPCGTAGGKRAKGPCLSCSEAARTAYRNWTGDTVRRRR